MDEPELRDWKFKQLLTRLRGATSAAKTSLITLIVPPEKQLNQISSLLATELSTAENIRNRVNRLGVMSALTTLQQKLKLYHKIPSNGLILLAGDIHLPAEKGSPSSISRPKLISLAIEPPRCIQRFLYRCDNRFHLDDLSYLIAEEGPQVGVIVLTGDPKGSTKWLSSRHGVWLSTKHSCQR